MSIVDLWMTSRDQLEGKSVSQLLGFAGDGKLRDGNRTSQEFREFLANIPSAMLSAYAEQCLSMKFDDSGLVLQDIVNEIGRRLDFQVENGLYKGQKNQIGFDGLWVFPNKHAVIVESKTTDAYRISLENVMRYRKDLIASGKISEQKSSVLYVVGRNDTGDLEAQIRGSRYAWDIRLISIDALVRLLFVKEQVEETRIIHQIHSILVPREFTRLDDIVDILFSATEDVKQEEYTDSPSQDEDVISLVKEKNEPVAFYDTLINRVQKKLGKSLVKRSRAFYATPNSEIGFVCLISKPYQRAEHVRYWFGFHPTQREHLDRYPESYVLLGCGSESNILVIPSSDFLKWLDKMHITERNNNFYWHVIIQNENGKWTLSRKKGSPKIDLTKYVLTDA